MSGSRNSVPSTVMPRPKANAVKNAVDAAPVRLPLLLRTQIAGNKIARAHAQHEADGLDDGHQRKHDAHGARRAGAQLRHKKRVGHIVHRRYQHADDGGHGQRSNEPWDGRLRHFPVLGVARPGRSAHAFSPSGFISGYFS